MKERVWAPGSVEIDFGAGAVVVPRGQVQIGLNHPVPMPADGPIDWWQLNQLPNLITIEWSGPDRGVVAAAAEQQVEFLYWTDAGGDIDLSGTELRTVRLGGRNLRDVRLPATLENLRLDDPPRSVAAPDNGKGLKLHANEIPPGLERIAALNLNPDRELSLSVLNGLTDLESLTVAFDRPPGTLTDLPALSTLKYIEIFSAYDWDPDGLPPMPALRNLTLDGVRRTTAAAVKARFDGKVSTRRIKTDEWLATHLFNPFRDWVHESKAFGTAACRAYTRAHNAVERGDGAEAALRGLVADLNRIDARYERIDTANREYACAVYRGLARHAGVDPDEAERWLAADRNW